MFEINKVYKRSDLHNKYGGNRQGGISSCAKHPMIFIFTGKTGEQYGYKDEWDEENIFHYTGEGQLGDMSFIRGNKALRDHIRNGKSIFLFEFDSNSNWKYASELELFDYEFFRTQDKNGHLRKGIRFRFKSKTK